MDNQPQSPQPILSSPAPSQPGQPQLTPTPASPPPRSTFSKKRRVFIIAAIVVVIVLVVVAVLVFAHPSQNKPSTTDSRRFRSDSNSHASSDSYPADNGLSPQPSARDTKR